MTESRRSILKKMGATGVSLGTVSIAGCFGGEQETEEYDRPVEEDLPEERRIERTFEHMAYTEEYSPNRYATNELVVETVGDVLGIDYEMDIGEASVLDDREAEGDFDFFTYTWESEQGGDPDNVITFRYHSDGQRNFGGYSNEEYDEIAEQSRQEYDEDARQELIYEAQELIGELRWESQYLYNEGLYGYNTDVVDEDSVIVDGRLRGTWVTWTEIEPGPENDDGMVATNNWDATNQLNPFDQMTIGPARNVTPTLLMHDTFIRYTEEYEQVNWIAEDIETVDDTTIVVEISDEFEFHDGEPLTVEDVLWTYETILETEPAAYLTSVTDPLESIEQTGDNEVTFHLEEPYVPFTTLTFWQTPILPAHYWEEILDETDNHDTPWEVSFGDDRPIVGSGPFEYESWDQGEQFIQTANHDHPIAPPNIETRVQRPLSSSAAELEALEQGEYGYLDYWFGNNEELADRIEDEPHLGMSAELDNMREATWMNVEEPPLDDVPFRQAYHAVVADLQPVFVEEIYDGYGETGHSPITPMIEFWHNPDVPGFEGGPETAIEILADAGYVWDEDGNLYAPE
ncbi:hypothetical protein D8Y22_07490 [Salinadaptatus halalkaliphilus]|uniref:Solute-binding protein family 5 domain-containing protein n=1 Tax=Salinadaptatus halalkaliphilus TaxID=2419781 RepID=A0A4S3TLM3_9EURY|nr:ABC transporter substrate-binding protein [Salinadaptatus halalkaliphilus]THE65062.1 hypothetical protein D8Y22_07490 [Salinadaptatus halalkaliphilus]